jgi:hypothetical protein
LSLNITKTQVMQFITKTGSLINFIIMHGNKEIVHIYLLTYGTESLRSCQFCSYSRTVNISDNTFSWKTHTDSSIVTLLFYNDECFLWGLCALFVFVGFIVYIYDIIILCLIMTGSISSRLYNLVWIIWMQINEMSFL